MKGIEGKKKGGGIVAPCIGNIGGAVIVVVEVEAAAGV